MTTLITAAKETNHLLAFRFSRSKYKTFKILIVNFYTGFSQMKCQLSFQVGCFVLIVCLF